jgi:hypothetical protein
VRWAAGQDGPAARLDVGCDKKHCMTNVAYEIVEHDGGWAYRVDGV